MYVCHIITVNNTHLLNKKLSRLTDFLHMYYSKILQHGLKFLMKP